MNFKLFFISIAAFVASLATFPYGYRFAALFPISHSMFYILLGCLFGITSMSANVILGIYSLLNAKVPKHSNLYVIAVLGILGAIPTGFFCYFGYKKILPVYLNVLASCIVFFVNIGINFTAIVNLLKKAKEIIDKHRNVKGIHWKKNIIIITGGIIGLLISITAYLATTNGIAHMIDGYFTVSSHALYFASFLAILPWLPLGALYLNSTAVVTEKLYNFFCAFDRNIKNVTRLDIILILYVILSGSAFARMVYDFYNPVNMIPAFFKLPSIQYIAYHFLLPLALFSSAAVNYFALINIVERK